MRTIYISDVTGKQYDTVEALQADEKKVNEFNKGKEEFKKRVDAAWDKVEALDKEWNDACEVAEKMTDEYEEKYGEYIVNNGNTDVSFPDFLLDFFKQFKEAE